MHFFWEEKNPFRPQKKKKKWKKPCFKGGRTFQVILVGRDIFVY